MFKRRLLWQLYPSFLLIIFISVISVAWYGSQSLHKFYLNQVAEDLKYRAHLIEKQVLTNLGNQRFKEIDDFCKQIAAASSTRITVILPSGEVIADSDEVPGRMKNHADRPEFQAALEQGSGKSLRFSETLGKRMMYLAIPIRQDDKVLAVVRTSVPVTAIDEALKGIYKKLFWAGVIIAVCAAAISLGISKKISRPVEQMTEVAKHFASGQLDLRLSIPNAAELADLAKALNEMAQQLNARINTITEERSQIQAILSSMVEGVLAVDSSGHIVSINKAAAELLRIDATNSHGRSVEEVARNPELQQYIKDTLDNKQPTETDCFVLNDSGRFLQLYGSSLTDNKDNNSGAVLVLHDITRTRQLEEVRRDFIANVSHELKTPVTSIKGFVETLLEGALNDPQETQKFLKIIAKHSDRLNAIIEDLLSLSRLEEDSEKRRLSFEKTSIRPTLVSAIELSNVKADQKQIAVELLCDKEITAKINAALIEQAVLNLIDNAIKYSQDNSKIQVTAQEIGNEVLIKVSDQGCGIEKEHLDRIFERFYVVDKGRSRKLGGTGLGLSIIKHIAQVHGGYVKVESDIGQGSTFTIHLPI
ncbi:MAG: HAMP domain-containing protein [Sedimentisphaerales bacterium]|nr:HAMP domain-containing protein [Sedimentisphaerales bacterium]